MSDKGAKGFSLPSAIGVKSSLKSTPSSNDGSLKGKDDSSTKSKKARKVQFDSEGSGEPKFNFSSKSDKQPPLGKGGKGDKGGNVKTKGSQPLELNMQQDLPKNAKCLMDCEAADILQGIQEQMVMLSRDPAIKIPVSFDKGMQYANRTNHYTNPQAVRQLLETLKKSGASDGEICVIANVCPETADEVFALVPSLKAKRSMVSEALKYVLSELVKLKQSA